MQGARVLNIFASRCNYKSIGIVTGRTQLKKLLKLTLQWIDVCCLIRGIPTQWT